MEKSKKAESKIVEATSSEVAINPNPITSYHITSPEDTKYLANDLARFIRENKLFHNIQGKEFVNCEGWQYAGCRLGIMPVIEGLTQIKNDLDSTEIKYEAKVKLLDLRTNQIVGTGFAICSNKESSKKYYQEFAIASMAQTRAIGKAYRNILAWIIRAAGYEPTPAEEMDYIQVNNNAPQVARTEPEKPATQPEPKAYPVQETETVIDLNPDDLPALLQTISELTTMDAWAKFAETYLQWQGVREFKDAMIAARIRMQAGESPISINQKTQILLLLNNSVIETDEKERMISKINTLNSSRAEQAIVKLKKVIAERTPPLEPNTKKAKTEKQAA